MKNLLLIFLLIIVSTGSFAQNERQPLAKEDYLRKSENQRKTGWILLGAGVAMGVGGAIIVDQGDIFSSDFEVGAILLSAGVVSSLASIPFFISSGSNARKAARISFHGQRYILPGGDLEGVQPALGLKIEF